MPINKTHSTEARGLDAYFTPEVAVQALVEIEHEFIPEKVYEPAVGAGNIASVLEASGYEVYCADIRDYGYQGTIISDFLKTKKPPLGCQAIITNPPFRFAKEFCELSVKMVPYVAMIARLQYLESMSRMTWLEEHPPTRIIIPSRRLPMMHRLGWDGPEASSNMCHPWFVWDAERDQGGLTEVVHYDWKQYRAENAGVADAEGREANRLQGAFGSFED